MLSGAFGGLLGSVPHADYLPACNAYLQRGGPPEGFVTAVHLTLDLVTGDYLISSAGHPPAAHFEVGSGRWRLTDARGIVLGVVPDMRSVPDSGSLRPGWSGKCTDERAKLSLRGARADRMCACRIRIKAGVPRRYVAI